MPPSAAWSRIATAVGSSHCSPNVIVPRHSLRDLQTLSAKSRMLHIREA